MSSPVAFPLLSLLPGVPALSSLVIWLIGARRPSLARGIAVATGILTLLAAGSTMVSVMTASGEPVNLQPRPWIVSLGASYVLGVDPFSSALALWVALSSLVALLSKTREYRAATWILSAEAVSLGLFFARDVLLVFAFYGGVLAVLVLMMAGRRMVFIYQMAGLALLSGFFVRCYQIVFEQTGFVSTELARWQNLVLYPDTELRLFTTAFAGIAFVLPLFPFSSWLHGAVEKMPREGRLVLFGSFSLAGNYLLYRVVLPMCSRGVAGAVDWYLGLAVLSLVYAAILSGRNRGTLLVGFQALVLVALLLSPDNDTLGVELQMMSVAIGTWGLAMGGTRLLSALFALFLLGTPTVCVLPLLAGFSRSWAVLVSFAFLVFALRVARESLRSPA